MSEKLTYQRQVVLGLVLLGIMHLCAFVTRRGIFINLAWVLYGVSFIVHPAVPAQAAGVRHIRAWVRLAGALCVLLGLLIRFYP